jgi:succinyl-CoA synthetase beta subunit
VKAVLIHEGVDLERQIYIGLLMDRKYGGPVILASKFGTPDPHL